ncbi:MAG: SRPBCC domain-containing protein, partial [Ornithinimicrobium sp.]
AGRFRAPVDHVWAAVTDPERLERWIGTWEGDPASGEVVFRMTAEGPDAPPEPLTIHECRAPHVLKASVGLGDEPGMTWSWELDLHQEGDVTTLTFAQSVAGSIPVHDVGPGWEYYLDRLVADLGGGDVAAVDFEDYYPEQSGYYRDLFPSGPPDRLT